MFQHVRPISKKKAYPNSQIKLSTQFHPLFPKWSTPGKWCWSPRVYCGYKYNVQPRPLSYQHWLWRKIQSLKCWTQMAWSCSYHIRLHGVLYPGKLQIIISFRMAQRSVWWHLIVCVLYINWIKWNRIMKIEDACFGIKNGEIWCCWFTPKDMQEVKFLFISVQWKPHVVLKSYFLKNHSGKMDLTI
jgi:hypothetical protein